MSFDWRQIPVDLIEELPESSRPPKGSSARLLAKKASTAVAARRKKSPHEIQATSPKKSNQQEDVMDDIHQLPLTFNNCHFHLDGVDGDKEETSKTGNGERRGRPQNLPSLANLISERMSKLKDRRHDFNSSTSAPQSHSRASPQTSPSRMSMSELGRAKKPLLQTSGNRQFVSSSSEIEGISRRRRQQDQYQTHNIVADLSLTEPSDYIREGMEREKQVLETVHQELSDLSRDLKVCVVRVLQALLCSIFCRREARKSNSNPIHWIS